MVTNNLKIPLASCSGAFTDFGIIKGQTPVTDEKINEIINYLTELSKQ